MVNEKVHLREKFWFTLKELECIWWRRGGSRVCPPKSYGCVVKKRMGEGAGGANRSFRGEEFDFGFICGEKKISLLPLMFQTMTC